MTDVERPTLAARLEQDGITAEAEFDSNPADAERAKDSDAWKVTLIHPAGRRMTTPFYTGYKWREWRPDGPAAEDVLDSLLSDATGWLNADGFEDWAREYGYDTDSRKAERTFNAIGEQVEELRVFLGEAFEDYVWRTELP